LREKKKELLNILRKEIMKISILTSRLPSLAHYSDWLAASNHPPPLPNQKGWFYLFPEPRQKKKRKEISIPSEYQLWEKRCSFYATLNLASFFIELVSNRRCCGAA
jgi:hypothetical protein